MINTKIVDGIIEIDNNKILIPDVTIIDEIGRGANAIIYKGIDNFLKRPLAIKIWLKLRDRDERDKFKQGVEEAKKAIKVADESIIKIYSSGKINDIFYIKMEYLKWITVNEWLTTSPTLGKRWQLAIKLFEVLNKLHSDSVYHGDLHTKNILINNSNSNEIEFKVIDFGTSYFSENSDRHWKVITETFDKILSPIKFTNLYDKVGDIDFKIKMGQFLEKIPRILIEEKLISFEWSHSYKFSSKEISSSSLDNDIKTKISSKNIGSESDWNSLIDKPYNIEYLRIEAKFIAEYFNTRFFKIQRGAVRWTPNLVAVFGNDGVYTQNNSIKNFRIEIEKRGIKEFAFDIDSGNYSWCMLVEHKNAEELHNILWSCQNSFHSLNKMDADISLSFMNYFEVPHHRNELHLK